MPVRRKRADMVLTFFQFPKFPRIYCVFTGRGQGAFGGNISFNADAASALEARQWLLEYLRPYGLLELAECRQIHGVDIIEQPEPCQPLAEAMSREAADAMLTDKPGLGLIIKTADCQPLLMAAGQYVMAAHVGWRGNQQHFPTICAKSLAKASGREPADIYAVRGPSLGLAEFDYPLQAWRDENFLKWHDAETRNMDLWQMTRSQLQDAGVPQDHIYGIDIDTLANADSFFSWRKDKTQGRQAALIWIKGD